jgi:acetylornithine/succinyldiaminopimelate/putrescine aminotransferase
MDNGLLEHVARVGAHFERQLGALTLKHPLIVERRGVALMQGLQLASDAAAVVDLARERGLLVNRTNEKVVRMLPPLTVDVADLDRAVEILDGVFASIEAAVHA